MVVYCYDASNCTQLAVRLAGSDWQGLDPILPKAVLRFVLTISGVLFVMTSGMILMLVWPADSWDSPDTVSLLFCFVCFDIDVFEKLVGGINSTCDAL